MHTVQPVISAPFIQALAPWLSLALLSNLLFAPNIQPCYQFCLCSLASNPDSNLPLLPRWQPCFQIYSLQCAQASWRLHLGAAAPWCGCQHCAGQNYIHRIEYTGQNYIHRIHRIIYIVRGSGHRGLAFAAQETIGGKGRSSGCGGQRCVGQNLKFRIQGLCYWSKWINWRK